jgi:integrase
MTDVPKPILLGKLRCAVKGGVKRYNADSRTWYWQVTTRGRGAVQVDSFRATVSDAEERLAQLVADRAEERVERRQDSTEDRPDTVGDLLLCWGAEQEDRVDMEPATLESYRTRVRRLRPRIGHLAISQVGDHDVETYVRRLVREGYALRTAHHDVDALRMAWRLGRRRGWHHRSDFDVRLARPKKKHAVRSTYVPSDDEVRKVLRHLSGWALDAARLQWMSGARFGELSRLEVDDIDGGRRGVWVGRHERSKKTGERFVALGDEGMAIVRRWANEAGEGRIWPVTPKTMIDGINRRLRTACDAAEVPRFTSHKLVHRAADRLAEQRVDVVAAARHLGKSVSMINSTYRRVQVQQRDDVAAALERAGEHLRAVDSNEEG